MRFDFLPSLIHFPAKRARHAGMAASVVLVGSSLKAVNCDLKALSDIGSSVVEQARAGRCDGGELNLSFNRLSSLSGIDAFSNVAIVVLDNNELTSVGGMSTPFPNLHTLWLNNNQLEDIEEVLRVLATYCPKLQYLSLLKNPCCPHLLSGKGELEYQRYRIYVKHRLPTLTMLDAQAVSDEEAEQARERGRFMQTRTAAAASAPVAGSAPSAKSDSQPSVGSAQPPTNSADDVFKRLAKDQSQPAEAVLSQQRHFYSGKTSEGNRFIGNDLL